MTTNRPSMTQRDNIKQHLKEGYSLTALEALSLFGAYRLAAHIEVLRKRGMPIHTQMCKDVTGRTYARYKLVVNKPYVDPFVAVLSMCGITVTSKYPAQKEITHHAN